MFNLHCFIVHMDRVTAMILILHSLTIKVARNMIRCTSWGRPLQERVDTKATKGSFWYK